MIAISGRQRHLFAVAIVWVLTRASMLSELGYLRYLRAGAVVSWQDVNSYRNWSDLLAQTQLPNDPAWQYPPGAALFFFLPRLVTGHYQLAFIALILIFDLVATAALIFMSRREGTSTGTWIWLLAIPALGGLPLLRFDVLPTAISLAALAMTAGERPRDRLFGAVVGVGIAVKAWPVLLLLSVPTVRRAWAAGLAATATVIATIVLTWATLGATGLAFINHHAARGLELEAVAATPWYVLQAVTGRAVNSVYRNGCYEIASPEADLVAKVLLFAMVLLAAALAAWWLAWQRSDAPKSAAVGRDAVFTAVLLYVVVSEVLSAQYVIWLVGLGAVAVTSPTCRVRRPVAAVLVAVLLTRVLLKNWDDLLSNGADGAYLLTFRNLVLVAGAIDAALTMWRFVQRARP